MNVRADIKGGQSLMIFIDELPHLILPISSILGLQSWLPSEGSNKYCIELLMWQNDPVLLEYEDRKLWEQILLLIAKELWV